MKGAIQRRLDKLEQELDQKQLLDVAYDHFVKVTPIDTGNARQSTVKQLPDTIHAAYAYATRLNTGWSKQAKKGMAEPTIRFLQNYIKNVRK